MPGITRIQIVSDWHRRNDWRLQLAHDHAPIANEIYRAHFNLADGEETIQVSKDDAKARYDWQEGIDVILTAEDGCHMTLQEKFLTYHISTMTFEERKSNGAPGAWYYCTAQYYFIGYTREYWDYRTRTIKENPIVDFQDYMMIDLPALHRADWEGLINWQGNQNQHDGRAAPFRYVPFNEVPSDCVIFSAEMNKHQEPSQTALPF